MLAIVRNCLKHPLTYVYNVLYFSIFQGFTPLHLSMTIVDTEMMSYIEASLCYRQRQKNKRACSVDMTTYAYIICEYEMMSGDECELMIVIKLN